MPCVYRKLNPNVLSVKAAQDGVRNDGAGSLNRTRDRRILLQRPMRSNAVVIGRIVFQNSAQMCPTQHDDVIQTLAPDRSDQPFSKAILPGRTRCDRLVPNPHGAQSPCDDRTIDAIPVPDQVARSLFQGNASVIWCAIQCAVGLVVTLIQTTSLRSSRIMTKP
jgi:hypothetical protein